MHMRGFKERALAPKVSVSLEELVPPDHFYRHLERELDLLSNHDLETIRAELEL